MKNKLKENAITLIALVITIIVLLILVGITVAQLSENNLFENAKLAKEKYKQAELIENNSINDYNDKIDDIVGSRATQEDIDRSVEAALRTIDITSSFHMDSTAVSARGNVQMTKSGNTIVLIGYFNVLKAFSYTTILATIDEQYRPKEDYQIIAMYNNNSVINMINQRNGNFICGGNLAKDSVLTINTSWQI